MNRNRRFRLGLLAVFVATLATLLVLSPGTRMDSGSGPGSGAGAPATAAPPLDEGLAATGRDPITLSRAPASSSAGVLRDPRDGALRSLNVQVVDRRFRHGIQDMPVALTIVQRFPGEEEHGTILTDAQGFASFPVPTGRFQYRLVGDAKAAYPGFQSIALGSAGDDGSICVTIDLPLVPARTAKVVDDTGVAVPNAVVAVSARWYELGWGVDSRTVYSRLTAADGRCELPALVGNVELQVNAPGHLPLVESAWCALDDEPGEWILLLDRERVVTVVVSEADGRKVGGAHVSVRCPQDEGLGYGTEWTQRRSGVAEPVITGQQGTARVLAPLAGEASVLVHHAEVGAARVSVDPLSSELAVSLGRGGSFTAQTIPATGFDAGPGSVRYQVIDSQDDAMLVERQCCGADREWRAAAVEEGGRIAVRAPTDSSEVVAVVGVEGMQLVACRLARSWEGERREVMVPAERVLAGRVLDAAGAPAGGVRLRLSPLGEPPALSGMIGAMDALRLFARFRVITDERGEFRFSGLWDGMYAVEALDPLTRSAVTRSVLPAGMQDAVLRLGDASPDARLLRFEAADSVTGAPLSVVTYQEVYRRSNGVQHGGRGTLADSRGMFETRIDRPGLVGVAVGAADYHPQAWTRQALEDLGWTVRAELRRCRPARIVLQDAEGKPRQGAVLRLQDFDGSPVLADHEAIREFLEDEAWVLTFVTDVRGCVSLPCALTSGFVVVILDPADGAQLRCEVPPFDESSDEWVIVLAMPDAGSSK